MHLKMLKFGGSSISDSKRIHHVAEIILNEKKNVNLGIVVSAMGGITDDLIELADSAGNQSLDENIFINIRRRHFDCINELLPGNDKVQDVLESYFKELREDLSSISAEKKLSPQFLDKILSFGERCSSAIMAQYLSHLGLSAEQLDAREVVLTDDQFGNAYVHYQRSFNRIRSYYKSREKTQVITGFLGATEGGETTTLGRSGSDYTAAIFGAALNASAIEILTDVDGILSTDPNIVHESKTVSHLTYEEAMELAHAGARVIFPPTMIPALYKGIPIRIKNTFNPSHEGSLITRERKLKDEVAVGISSVSDVTLIRLQGAGMVGMKGLIARIFSSLAQDKINIILVSQAFSEHSVCFAINPHRIKEAVKSLKEEFGQELRNHYIDKIKVEEHLSLVAVVGEGMRHTPGISGRVFSVLGRENINVVAIAQGSSERNISFIVDAKEKNRTLTSIHSEFFGTNQKVTDIYLAGVGTIGGELLSILDSVKSKDFSIRGVATSKKMLLINDELDSKKTIAQLNDSELPYSLDDFISDVHGRPRQKIFVDCTASESLAKDYLKIIQKGFSIVTANKVANSLDQTYYNTLRETAGASGVDFRYETNVGAGLPIISTLRGLLDTGDEIIKIEGIMSGTLSYLFNQFDGTVPFSTLVKNAREKGFTEPDPRDDLSGMDVARKILILARETGASLDLSDVEVENLVPKALTPSLSVDEFLGDLNAGDEDFKRRYSEAKAENKVLRYIGSWDGKKARVGLQTVGPENPFYGQKGRENFIVIQSKRYNDVPLVIKGHGAGAAVTAAGVLSDIQSCIKNR